MLEQIDSMPYAVSALLFLHKFIQIFVYKRAQSLLANHYKTMCQMCSPRIFLLICFSTIKI